MQKLTITVEDELYKALYAQIGRGKISRYMSEATKVKLRKDRDREKSAQVMRRWLPMRNMKKRQMSGLKA